MENLSTGIDIQKAIDAGVHEAANHAGWQTQASGDGEQVGEQRAVVPAEMAVGAGLILPSVAPVGAGANDGERGMGDGGFATGRFQQRAAMVSGPKTAQAELGGGEVIDAGIEVGETAANQIKLDFVERAGTSGGAKVEFSAGIFPFAGDARGEVEELGNGLQIRRCVSLGGDGRGDGREGGYAGLAHLAGQGHGLERRINLERQRLVVPVQEMGVGADTGVRMFGGVVIAPSGVKIAVVNHGNDELSSQSKGSISG